MWYFTWMLGLAMACAFAIINALWYEFHSDQFSDEIKKIKKN